MMKGMAKPKAAALPKGAADATSKNVSSPPKVTAAKASAPSKVATPKAAAAKTAILVAPSTAGGAVRQNRPPGATKAGVLKINAGAKRPVSTAPSLMQTAKHPKATTTSSSVPTSVKRVAAHSLPTRGSDDDRVEVSSMLGVASTTSSSSSSSESLALESARASQPNVDMATSLAVVIAGLELPVTPEIPELDMIQSAGMFLNEFTFAFGLESHWLSVLGVSVDDVGTSLRRVTQEFASVEIADEDDKQIIDCLEHVSF
jgi:hypothetical protein